MKVLESFTPLFEPVLLFISFGFLVGLSLLRLHPDSFTMLPSLTLVYPTDQAQYELQRHYIAVEESHIVRRNETVKTGSIELISFIAFFLPVCKFLRPHR